VKRNVSGIGELRQMQNGVVRRRAASRFHWIGSIVGKSIGRGARTGQPGRLSYPFLLRALVDPGAEQSDLVLGERVGFAFGRHHHVLDEAGDAVNE